MYSDFLVSLFFKDYILDYKFIFCLQWLMIVMEFCKIFALLFLNKYTKKCFNMYYLDKFILSQMKVNAEYLELNLF